MNVVCVCRPEDKLGYCSTSDIHLIFLNQLTCLCAHMYMCLSAGIYVLCHAWRLEDISWDSLFYYIVGFEQKTQVIRPTMPKCLSALNHLTHPQSICWGEESHILQFPGWTPRHLPTLAFPAKRLPELLFCFSVKVLGIKISRFLCSQGQYFNPQNYLPNPYKHFYII